MAARNAQQFSDSYAEEDTLRHADERDEEDDAWRNQQEEIRAKYSSDYFVNGFLCEVPVVLDVERIRSLHEVLACNYTSASPTANNSDGTESSGITMSEGFAAAARSVTARLGTYLADVQVPPRLPQILFGKFYNVIIDLLFNYKFVIKRKV